MAEGAGAGVQRAYGGSHIDSGIAMGGLPGAIAGGAAGAQYDDGNPLTNETGAGVIGGALGGAMLGGGAGGMAKLVRMGMRGAGGGMSGFSGGLREALAEAASERGIGRAAAREASHVDDAARFAEASRGRDVPLIEDMMEAGRRPFARAPGAMDQMQELEAARRILQRTKIERSQTTDPEEIAYLDEEIAELSRLLGVRPIGLPNRTGM
jgi:hypothetical protein